MFDIGFSEMLLVGIVALLVLGPDKLPGAARTCGLWIGKIKRSVTSIQEEITEELRAEELKRTVAEEKKKLQDELGNVSKPFSDVADAVKQSTDSLKQDVGMADKPAEKAESSANSQPATTSDREEKTESK